MADEFKRKLSEERATYQKLFSPETLPECASYRERQADELIKRMETVPEGSPAYKFTSLLPRAIYWLSVSLRNGCHEDQRHHNVDCPA
jgi:hypothetical protein